jgi:hypothetical protein
MTHATVSQQKQTVTIADFLNERNKQKCPQ